MKKIAALFITLLTFTAMQCEKKTTIQPGDDLSGEWTVENVFLGDVIDTPCGYEVKDSPKLTINFEDEKKAGEEAFRFSGKSAVNQFFGTYKITSFDKTTGVGTVEMGAIGSTKMAGPEPLMQCENRYFSLLEDVADFSIAKENGQHVLRIGRFKKDDKPSRDGGTFLILKR